MKKIVHYIPALVNGGIESMLLNYYNKLNDKYKFIIIVHGDIEKSCRKKFESLGAVIYYIPHWTKNFFKHNKELYRILKNEKPSIFHTHHGIYNFLPCMIAMFSKIKIRISHCHAYFPKVNKKDKIFSLFSYFFATNYAACGKGAAEYLVSFCKNKKNNVKIIYNSIELDKFKYNETVRNKIRKKLNWENNYIYGNVGRFSLQKNQLFLIDIYEKIFQSNNNSRFIIIGGDGEEYSMILNKLNNSLIRDYCLVLKNISNVNEYYSVMDCLLLPSLFEGFAVTVIEAQASNLPCVLSPTITKEFLSTNIYYSKSLNNINDWLNIIKKIKFKDRKKVDKTLDIFNINKSCLELNIYYSNLIGGKKL